MFFFWELVETHAFSNLVESRGSSTLLNRHCTSRLLHSSDVAFWWIRFCTVVMLRAFISVVFEFVYREMCTTRNRYFNWFYSSLLNHLSMWFLFYLYICGLWQVNITRASYSTDFQSALSSFNIITNKHISASINTISDIFSHSRLGYHTASDPQCQSFIQHYNWSVSAVCLMFYRT